MNKIQNKKVEQLKAYLADSESMEATTFEVSEENGLVFVSAEFERGNIVLWTKYLFMIGKRGAVTRLNWFHSLKSNTQKKRVLV